MSKVYISGKLVDKEQASVSVFDHGLLYGDGVFEGIRVYGGKVFRLDQHVGRLYDCARAIRLEIPMTPAEFDKYLRADIEKWAKIDAEEIKGDKQKFVAALNREVFSKVSW